MQAPTLPALDLLDDTAASHEFGRIRRKAQRLVVELSSHYDYLAQLH
jgi:hypothetical protein